MRLLAVSQYFWPESFTINEVILSLKARGIDVSFLTGKPNYPDGVVFEGYRARGLLKEDWQGIRVYRVPMIPRGRSGAMRLAANYLSFIASVGVFGPWLVRKEHPDAILVYCPSPLLQALSALFLGRLKGVPVLVWVQDLWPESLESTGYVKNRLALGLVRELVKFLYQHTDRVLISSRSFAAPISAMVPTARISYLPNSVDVGFCAPESALRTPMPELDDGFCVVFAGNIGAAQAMDVVVMAAEKLASVPEIRFVVIGSGSRLEWMRQEVLARRLANVHLVGRYPAAAMPYLLSRASALLVTLADRPIFAATVPNKVQAYLAVGRPVVGCLNGEGARLIEEAQAGLTVPAEDPDGLARAILELHRMTPEARRKMGENGRSFYRQNFDHELLVDRLIGLIEDTVKEHQ
jgi:glycosyltransferase involved in cell wall biosynthesis